MKICIGDTIGNSSAPLSFKESDVLVDNQTLIGVEIEVENIDYRSNRDRLNRGINTHLFSLWSHHEDGSLRNGSEYIFKMPYSGVNIVNALNMFDDFVNEWDLKNPSNKITISDRCSVHVHLDVRNMDDTDMINLISWYLFVERLLFNYVDPSRYKNSYCRPLINSSFIMDLQLLISNIKNRYNEISSDQARSNYIESLVSEISYRSDKYNALNIRPISSFGSIEFRHHSGTKSGEKVLDWVNIILALKKWSDNNNFNDFHKSDFNLELVRRMFIGTKLLNNYIDPEDCALGYKDAYQFTSFKHLKYYLFRSGVIDRVVGVAKPSFMWRYKKANNLLPISTQKKMNRKTIVNKMHNNGEA